MIQSLLQIWTAVVLEELPPYGDLTPTRLAEALRKVAALNKRGVAFAFLLEMAKALESPDTGWSLKLGLAKRGKPPDLAGRFERARSVGALVDELVSTGCKKEAAVQEAMTAFGLSRSQVMRSLSDWRRLKKPLLRDKLSGKSSI